VYVGAASATATLKVQSTKVANKVEFGTFTGTFAEKDTKIQYIPIVAYDADGNKLSADDIAQNAKDKRFTVSVSGASFDSTNNGNASIELNGEHKGQIKVGAVSSGARSVVFVNLGIYTSNIQNSVQASYTIQDVRKPETVVLDGDKPAQKAINDALATTTVKWFVKDQYGDQFDTATDTT
ncbi:S-layer homology domain-containing protein, partial [Paenibacillus sp. TAF58]